MHKYKFFNIRAVLRAFIVVGVSLGVYYIAGTFLRDFLDALYRSSSVDFWRNIFMKLSNSRIDVAVYMCFFTVVLFSGWIFAPVFQNISELVSQSLQISEDSVELKPVRFPKSLRQLESNLDDINKELQLWKYAVRQAEQRKDDLVVYLAHDIRTPLTSVLGYLELLSENPDLPEDKRQKFADIALRKAKRMEILVEELFEITRFNVGQIELERREVNGDILFNQLLEELAPKLENKNIHTQIENKGLNSLFIDPDKMARAIDNVLHNAIYYTPQGGEIKITLELSKDNRSQISISNTGVDISDEKLSRFFEKFYRSDEGRQSESGGSGLGLAIAKKIIEAHGGSISADSHEQITTFTIII